MLAALKTHDGKALDLTLTTNASLLARKAQAFKAAGLQRVTVSLDSLDETVFRAMNDVDFPVADVLKGIDAAHDAGFAPIKINMVVKKDVNEQDIVAMARVHAAVVELIALDDAEIKYSTVQNWYPGDPVTGKGGIYNFVTKRADCRGDRSKVSWTQVETSSAITWKYPSCMLRGEGSSGEFYSIAITNGRQQADTGTKMLHLGANTRSRIISKGISAGRSSNTYRGLVSVHPTAAR
jgi:hypothetical protein